MNKNTSGIYKTINEIKKVMCFKVKTDWKDITEGNETSSDISQNWVTDWKIAPLFPRIK